MSNGSGTCFEPFESLCPASSPSSIPHSLSSARLLLHLPHLLVARSLLFSSFRNILSPSRFLSPPLSTLALFLRLLLFLILSPSSLRASISLPLAFSPSPILFLSLSSSRCPRFHVLRRVISRTSSSRRCVRVSLRRCSIRSEAEEDEPRWVDG